MSPDPLALAGQLLESSRQALEIGRLDLARENLRRLIVLDPGTAALWFDLAGTMDPRQSTGGTELVLRRGAMLGDRSGRIQEHAGVRLARHGLFETATRCFQDAFRHRPDDFNLGMMLAAAQSKAGNENAGFLTLSKMIQRAREAGDAAALSQLADFLHKTGDVDQLRRLVPDFVSVLAKPEVAGLALLTLSRARRSVVDHLDGLSRRLDLFDGKASFYALDGIAADLWSNHPSEAINFLIRLARHPACADTFKGDATIAEPLLQLASEHSHSLFSTAVTARFRDRDIEKFIRCLAQAIRAEEIPAASYERPIEFGDFAGHSLWHLCNPFFAAWHRASSESRDVQDNWVNDPAISGAGDDDVITSYHQWTRNAAPIKDLVRGFTDRIGTTARYLDIGCGTGHWLRFLVESAGVDISGIHGIDLHQNRTRSAVTLLRDWAKANNTMSAAHGLEDRVFACDVFKDGDILRERLSGDIDAVMLFFVTGCFEDEALPGFLAKALSMRPRFVFHATVVDRWTLYRGRPDDHRYFAPLGYKLVDQATAANPLPHEDLKTLLLPHKYWPNFRIDIFEREGA